MPRINRVRVNNINYNDGTQRYDDFVMNFNGKNSLYDLVNGGGKSILLMMLMQTVLPNQELDKKQPVSKLFKGSNNNTTIHSMVEWILDKEASQRYHAKYLLAGFCAKKGGEGKGEVEYFNYAITYSKYNDFDIKNFSLTEGNEKVNYSGLRKKLRQLQDLNLLDSRVTMFETNDEYKKFLSTFGIYESHWNIIRGINVSEGRVRTYIEENYKTTRKLVDKLLIEEIIEKANSLKSGNYDEDLGKALLDIEEKLTEFSKKKKDIDKYKNQVQALEQFILRVKDYVSILEESDFIIKDYISLYKMIYSNHLLIKDEHKALNEDIFVNKSKLEYEEQYIDALIIKKEEEEFFDVEKSLSDISEKVKAAKDLREKLREELNYKEALKYYLDYKENKSRHSQVLSEINQIGENSKEKLLRIQYYVYYKKKYLDQELDKFEKDKKELIHNKDENILLQKRLVHVQLEENKELGKLSAQIENEMNHISNINNSIKECNNRILNEAAKLPNSYPLLEDEVLLIKYEEDRNHIMKEIEVCNQGVEDETKRIKDYEAQYRVNAALRPNIEQRINELTTFLREFQEKLIHVYDIKKILLLDENTHNTAVLSYLQAKEEDNKRNKYLKEQRYYALKKYFTGLEEGRFFVDNEDLNMVFEYLRSKSSHVELGTEFIKDIEKSEKEALLHRIPIIPYSIIVEDSFYKQIVKQLKFDWLNLNSIVPIISNRAIREINLLNQEESSILYLQNKVDIYIHEEYLEDEKVKRTKELTKLEKELKEHEDNIKTYQDFYFYVKDFHDHYELKRNKSERNLKELEGESKKLIENDIFIQKEIEEGNDRIIDLKVKSNELNEYALSYQNLIQLVNNRIDLNNRLDESNITLRQYESKASKVKEMLDELNNSLIEASKNIRRANEKIDGIEKKIESLSSDWQRKYSSYYINGNYEPCIDCEEDITIELNAAIKTYEDENHDLKGKKEILSLYEKGMSDTLKEIENRDYNLQFFKEKEALLSYFLIHENEIKAVKEHLKEAEGKLDHINTAYMNKKSEYDSLSGKITLMKETFTNKYSNIITIEEDDQRELATGILRHKNKKQALKDYLKERYKQEEEIQVEKRKIESLLEKMNNFVESLNISIDLKEVNISTKISSSQLSNSLETLRHKMNQNTSTKNERYKLCNKAKEKCVTDISEYNYLYGDELNKCIIPHNYHEAYRLREDLNKSKDYFIEEIERIDEGLKEIIEIKDRFTQKCLQKSQSIKADLEKFAKFSKMYMDNEEVQAVKLRISYLPEDIRKNKMEQYIERIVYEVASIKEEEDKRKLLREKLSGRSLFSVIISESGGMELSLYKRERVKETSRHLRYEEAVGSTGQSQGIYILLIIAIINYIARMYSNDVDDKNITKTIFIDNPFGAAKDVYIWEPILSMLKENNVQLIVPTRGVSPAMTSKFDVYYTLGQDMIGNKLQTVVTRFRSDINIDEVEYVTLESKQLDLFSSFS